MPKRSASLTSNTRDYSEFLKGVKLFIVALDSVSSSIDREEYWACNERKDGMVRLIETSYRATNIKGHHFDVIGRLEISILSKADNSEVLKIACQYSSHFHSGARVDKGVADRFAKGEAKIILWPYFRQLVTDLSARMFIPPIIIPISLDAK
ncbi:MAG: hypothetical protein ACLGSD_02935 [Acidobacteriota bacterium]